MGDDELRELLALLRWLKAEFEELRPLLARYKDNPAARFRRRSASP